jgi:hypothetical protein
MEAVYTNLHVLGVAWVSVQAALLLVPTLLVTTYPRSAPACMLLSWVLEGNLLCTRWLSWYLM